MADPYQLSDAESDLPEPVFACLSPAPGGDEDGIELLPHGPACDHAGDAPPAGIRFVILEPDDIVVPPPVEPDVAPRHRRDASQDARGRRLLQTFANLERLHRLPSLQQGQLPLDLYQDMLRLLPPGEDDSALFRFQFISRLPQRLRVFCWGLSNHSNEALAKVADYLWRFWATKDPAVNPVYFHQVPRGNGVGLPTVHPNRRSRRSRRPRRASTPPPPGFCNLPGDCGCWNCQTR